MSRTHIAHFGFFYSSDRHRKRAAVSEVAGYGVAEMRDGCRKVLHWTILPATIGLRLASDIYADRGFIFPPMLIRQVVAIAVFFALAFGYYVFFTPFVGMERLKIMAITLYSPTAVVVFVLYVWCVAKDPADSSVLHAKQHSRSPSIIDKSGSIAGAGGQDVGRQSGGQLGKGFPSSHSGSQKAANPGEENASSQDHATSQRVTIFCCNDCKCKSTTDVPVPEVEMLYCSLCKAEICIHSKHCRVCDKCVDGFDHHCRWLNNCVGRKNYNGFFALMISALFMLLVQWSLGLWVLVHCFLNLSRFEGVIASKLGSSFSPMAYIIVVVICTVLAMTASYPLGQLLCFHVLLVKKGISTYDYIIAMREQEQKAVGESVQSPLTSPVSSLGTMNSATSSAVGIHGRAWCTPPRHFFDHEDSYLPERSLPSKDVELGVHSKSLVEENMRKKATVKLSPWALASMNREDVLRAVISAKNKSSIVRPIGNVNEKAVVTETDSSMDSSRDVSAEFNLPSGEKRGSQNIAKFDVSRVHHPPEVMSWQSGKLSQEFLEQLKDNETDASQLVKRGKRPLNPVQIEARNAFKTSQSFSNSGGILGSSPDSSVNSPDVHGSRIGQTSIIQSHWPWLQKSGTDERVGSSNSVKDKSNSLPCTPAEHSLVNVHYSL